MAYRITHDLDGICLTDLAKKDIPSLQKKGVLKVDATILSVQDAEIVELKVIDSCSVNGGRMDNYAVLYYDATGREELKAAFGVQNVEKLLNQPIYMFNSGIGTIGVSPFPNN